MELTKIQIEEIRKASSIEELVSLAKENDIDLAKETAASLFNAYCANKELSEEELDNVTGGCDTTYSSGVKAPGGKEKKYAIVTAGNSCPAVNVTRQYIFTPPNNCGYCDHSFGEVLTLYCCVRWEGHEHYNGNRNAPDSEIFSDGEKNW